MTGDYHSNPQDLCALQNKFISLNVIMSTTKASKPDFLGALTAGKFGAAGKATAVKTAALKDKAASAAGSRKKAKGSKPGDTHQFILKDTSGKSYLVDV